MRTYTFSVGSAETGLRLDRYLRSHLPTGVSRAMIQRGIRGGMVTVGGRRAKVHCKLHHGDVVSARFFHLPAPARHLLLTPQALPLDIVYEDAELLVVNKPAGLVTHPAPGHWDGTLVNAILWHLSTGHGAGGTGQGDDFPPLPRAGIVHRLDKDTSGLLLVAKTEAALRALSRQLKARAIRRRYVALVDGRLPLDTGTINAPLGRHLTHRKVMTVRHLGGRLAVTHYRVLKRASLQELKPPLPYTVVDVSLDTGRTHQIRVHLAHLGHPLVGDATYGRRPANFWQSVGVTRQLLHAYRLGFQHPVSGRSLTVSAPVPDDMAQWCGGDILREL